MQFVPLSTEDCDTAMPDAASETTSLIARYFLVIV
jgi:hypothetical protein